MIETIAFAGVGVALFLIVWWIRRRKRKAAGK